MFQGESRGECEMDPITANGSVNIQLSHTMAAIAD